MLKYSLYQIHEQFLPLHTLAEDLLIFDDDPDLNQDSGPVPIFNMNIT